MTKKYDLNAIAHGCITLGVIILLCLLARQLKGVLIPFLASWFIAYMLCPVVKFFQVKCRLKSRGLSVTISMVLLLILLIGIQLIIVPPMINELIHLTDYVATQLVNFDTNTYWTNSIIQAYEVKTQRWNWVALLQNKSFVDAVNSAAPQIWQMLNSGVSALISLSIVLICILYTFFLLLDWEQLDKELYELVPKKYQQKVHMVMTDVSTNMNIYFRNQGLVALIQGIIFAVGFELIGLPLGLVLGLLIGILTMIPYLKALGFIPAVLLAILECAETGRPLWVILLCMLGIFIFAQALEDFVLIPKIMGKAMHMHPAVILLALSIWGCLFGIIGMIIALPLTTIILSYYKRYIVNKDEVPSI